MATTTTKILVIAGLVVLVGIAFAVGHWTGHLHAAHDRVAVHDPHDHDHDHAVPADADVEQWYTCSMHPQVRTTDPNEKCPICGMDLIPVPVDADNGDPTLPRLSVSPRAAALMQVQTWPVERRGVQRPVRLFGRVGTDERRVIDVVVQADSYIERLYANYTGKPLNRGEPLAALYSPAVTAAAEELLIAHRIAQTPGAERAVQAGRQKLHRLGVSDEEVEAILAAGEAPRTYTMTSPIDGYVKEMGGHEGHWLMEGEHLVELADLSVVWVLLEAYEHDLPWLRLGQEVAFSLQAYPGEQFAGTISFIQPVLEDRTRTVRVRVDVPNPDGRLKPGMFATGIVQARLSDVGPQFAAAQVDAAHVHAGQEIPLVIPATAPLITGQRAVVYVQVPDAERPTFEGRQVVLGPRAGDWYVVREGLREGELVVTHGNFKIDAELQIRGRPSMMAPHGHAAPVHDHGQHAQPPANGHVPVPHTHPLAEEPAAEQPAPPRFDVPEAVAGRIGALVEANFAIVDALSSDDPAGSREAAQAARRALEQVDGDLLDGAAGDVWRVSQVRMNRALTAMADAEDLASLRGSFEPFSDELTRVVRSFGSGPAAPVYRAMCPMVNDRRAYWLQPQQVITNPYWGEAMYRCGDVVETLSE